MREELTTFLYFYTYCHSNQHLEGNVQVRVRVLIFNIFHFWKLVPKMFGFAFYTRCEPWLHCIV